MKIELKIYYEFLDLLPEIKKLFSEDLNCLNALGLRLAKLSHLENGGYWCTPTNTLKFASTGTDGEHFSFLVQKNVINTESPIIFTAPCNYNGTLNVLIAKDFHTFMRLGIRHGYLALGELVYNPVEALKIYTNVYWQPTEERHFTFYVPSQQNQEIINFIANSLNLQPYTYTKSEFNNLQNCYMPLLAMSKEYYDSL